MDGNLNGSTMHISEVRGQYGGVALKAFRDLVPLTGILERL